MNFETLLQNKVLQLKNTKTIILIDGDDQRMIQAAKELKKYTNIKPILLVEKDEDKIEGLEFINIFKDQAKTKQFIDKYLEIRKGKETLEQASKALATRPFYAMMLVVMGMADGVVGGLLYPTADILRAAFKAIGTKEGIKTISSAMIMHKKDQTIIFSDISVNVKPTEMQLAEIGLNAQNFTNQMGIDPKVAFLSFSTSFSAKTPESELVKNATDLFNEKTKLTKAIGEVQLDAAINLDIRKLKYKSESFNEPANVLIFPDLNAGNIGYKIMQRFADFGAIGPIVVGTKKAVNDLSRGSTVNDVVNTVLITALQSENE
ncbi:phosphate acetyltransferase [Mycoplasmopsis cricetuli]|uniref:phosphate acetyltransferase n=1 Tax=Mycoplasmopsis cricetuli TaxID=171283 RepID=UPI000472209F|nr:phosphate acetyltransferase [Mycoplasmopsis cricetuli]